MTDEHASGRLDRRQALKRIGAIGTAGWAVPAIQTIRSSRILAQAGPGSPPPSPCGNARISREGTCGPPNFDPNAGCGGRSCLADADANAPSACGSIVSAVTADGADWVICIASGCSFRAISMAAAGACWSKPGSPDCTSGGGLTNFNWTGFIVTGSCASIARPTALNPAGGQVTLDISHVDLVICCGGD